MMMGRKGGSRLCPRGNLRFPSTVGNIGGRARDEASRAAVEMMIMNFMMLFWLRLL